jgi:peptidyl-prolyl cis-trans isomerase SurA
MKYLYTRLLLSTALFFSTLSQAEIQMLDRIVAIVDQATVTQSELDRRIGDIVRRMQGSEVKLPPMYVLRKQVLDQIISEKLQLNVARRFGVNPDEEEVNNAIRSMMSSRKMNENDLLQQLAKDGLTFNEFREEIRQQLTLQSVSQGIIGSRVKISSADIDNFLKSADAQFWISPEYHLQHILIPLGSSGGTQAASQAQSKAESVYQQLIDGANFSEMAIAESKGPAALKGGDLGFRKSSKLPTLLADIAANLEVGQISKPTRSQAGFHILKLLEKRGETKNVVRQSKVRHILVKTNEILSSEQALEKINSIRQQILAGSDFVELAKSNSDDIGSRMSGGDLGWSRPGQFVPEFEQAMEETEVGQISEPFLSQFGWHILEVVDRRDEDFSEEMIRMRARNLLVGRRFEDEMQVWLQEMRDDAYIEIKI